MNSRNVKKKVFKKAGFPVGVFLLVFIIQTLVAASGVAFHYHRTITRQIEIIEGYSKNYSMTMAESFARVCQLALKQKNLGAARDLFHEKIREGTVDEAFFVRLNGSIVLHSMKRKVKELRGNIANDEFYYNIDLILKPAKTKSREIQFSDYYLIERKIPFDRQQKELIRKYMYPDVKKNGWLVSRAVFHKGKPMGTVNFLISKDAIYTKIKTHAQWSIALFQKLMVGVFLLALFISLFVFMRYRMLQEKAFQAGAGDTVPGQVKPSKRKGVIEYQMEEMHRDGPYIHEPEDEPVIRDLVTGDLDEVHEVSRVDDPEEAELEELIDIEILADLDDEQELDLGETYQLPQGSVEYQDDADVMDAIPVARKH